MTYKLNRDISKISAPVTLIIDNNEIEYGNGSIAVDTAVFDKWYLIDEISVRDGRVLIHLKENTQINDTNWCGEEQVSFF